MNNNCPDGIIATVEKLIPSIYLVCNKLQLAIPDDIKVIGFSNLQSAFLLKPSLTTITQPAFEMGKTAAALLFKALKTTNFSLENEQVVIPSVMNIRNSTLAEKQKTMNAQSP